MSNTLDSCARTPTRPGRRGVRPVIALATTGLLATTGFVLAPTAGAAVSAEGISAPRHAKAHPRLSVGDSGPAVIYLTKIFDVPRSKTFSPALRTKVARFERRQGMNADGGRVGAGTWRALGTSYSKDAARALAQREARQERRADRRERRAERRAVRTPGTKAFGQRVLAEASKHRGKPYVMGGSGPGAFDCSGFTSYVYRQLGYTLPRTAAAQRSATKVISRSQVRKGDLVFVHSGGGISHAAIYAGGNTWWEATRPGRPLAKNSAWTSSVSYGRV